MGIETNKSDLLHLSTAMTTGTDSKFARESSSVRKGLAALSRLGNC